MAKTIIQHTLLLEALREAVGKKVTNIVTVIGDRGKHTTELITTLEFDDGTHSDFTALLM